MTYEALPYDELFKQAQAFHTGYFERAQALMMQLAHEGQTPQVLFIGCVDSRLVPEYLTRARPGDMMVMRTIANVIPPYSISESAVGACIEYAVRHLGVSHLVVCGHTDCGGIKALDKSLDMIKEPSLTRWVKHAQPAEQRAGKHSDASARHRAIVEANVALQLENAQTYACVREALEKGRLTLHGWVYDVFNGQVAELAL